MNFKSRDQIKDLILMYNLYTQFMTQTDYDEKGDNDRPALRSMLMQ